MNYFNMLNNENDQEQPEPYQMQFNKDYGSAHSSDKDRDDVESMNSGGEMPVQYSQQQQQEEDMINLFTCDFAGFAAHMVKQYGETQFNEGFAIVTRNKQLVYTEEGEEVLVQKLKHLFASEDTIRGFLNFCTSYIIVQNYSANINK